MIVTEIVEGFKNTYSDEGYYIQKVGTNEIYDEVYDVLDAPYTYIETETLIEDNPINELFLTRGDVFRGLYKAKGVTRAQIRALIEAMPEGAAKELALIDFDESLHFYRGIPLINQLGQQLGISRTQMTRFFKTNNYEVLNAN